MARGEGGCECWRYNSFQPIIPPCEHCYCAEAKPDHVRCCKCMTEMHVKFVDALKVEA